MRICLLTTQDLDAVPFPKNDWPCDPRPFLPEATWHVQVLEKPTAVETVTDLATEGYDLFFNLCDGAADEKTPGIEVVQTLERLRVPFTGATSEYYEPSRVQMKEACRAQGIDTPAHVLAGNDADVRRAADTLRFPLFVKHHSSYASVSLSRASRVGSGLTFVWIRTFSARSGRCPFPQRPKPIATRMPSRIATAVTDAQSGSRTTRGESIKSQPTTYCGARLCFLPNR